MRKHVHILAGQVPGSAHEIVDSIDCREYSLRRLEAEGPGRDICPTRASAETIRKRIDRIEERATDEDAVTSHEGNVKGREQRQNCSPLPCNVPACPHSVAGLTSLGVLGRSNEVHLAEDVDPWDLEVHHRGHRRHDPTWRSKTDGKGLRGIVFETVT